MTDTFKTWTPEEFRNVAAVLDGSTDNALQAVADSFEQELSAVADWASGSEPVPEKIQRRLAKLIGILVDAETRKRPEEWLLATGSTSDEGERDSYLFHAWPPRFVAHLVGCDPDGVPDDDVDISTGIIWRTGYGSLLCEFRWIDPPAPESMASLLEAASDLIGDELNREILWEARQRGKTGD